MGGREWTPETIKRLTLAEAEMYSGDGKSLGGTKRMSLEEFKRMKARRREEEERLDAEREQG